jgi:hypothetical protein
MSLGDGGGYGDVSFSNTAINSSHSCSLCGGLSLVNPTTRARLSSWRWGFTQFYKLVLKVRIVALRYHLCILDVGYTKVMDVVVHDVV